MSPHATSPKVARRYTYIYIYVFAVEPDRSNCFPICELELSVRDWCGCKDCVKSSNVQPTIGETYRGLPHGYCEFVIHKLCVRSLRSHSTWDKHNKSHANELRTRCVVEIDCTLYVLSNNAATCVVDLLFCNTYIRHDTCE